MDVGKMILFDDWIVMELSKIITFVAWIVHGGLFFL